MVILWSLGPLKPLCALCHTHSFHTPNAHPTSALPLEPATFLVSERAPSLKPQPPCNLLCCYFCNGNSVGVCSASMMPHPSAAACCLPVHLSCPCPETSSDTTEGERERISFCKLSLSPSLCLTDVKRTL